MRFNESTGHIYYRKSQICKDSFLSLVTFHYGLNNQDRDHDQDDFVEGTEIVDILLGQSRTESVALIGMIDNLIRDSLVGSIIGIDK